MKEHTCPRCGCTLRVLVVRVPVYLDQANMKTGRIEQVLIRYDDEEEVSDCPRCTGAY